MKDRNKGCSFNIIGQSKARQTNLIFFLPDVHILLTHGFFHLGLLDLYNIINYKLCLIKYDDWIYTIWQTATT